ncbi:hypothetical protein LVY72_09355 [Arthrobacter sp. I2-34]|uniref:Uncharacterized protein n=1 Tax=Arthrobacter hankyongi TaxID=2904801 RepID=A0ABS9L6L1_9MICC|nr:hypothetical protein [Arthrobacter hankyongi]MCG2622124.1 hypothetical protein [Arthrobacter hankyongi]
MALTASGPEARAGAGAPPRPSEQLCCRDCGSADYLVFDDFVPARLLDESQWTAASASYSCSQCGGNGGREVPPDWVPPGWFWYQ